MALFERMAANWQGDAVDSSALMVRTLAPTMAEPMDVARSATYRVLVERFFARWDGAWHTTAMIAVMCRIPEARTAELVMCLNDMVDEGMINEGPFTTWATGLPDLLAEVDRPGFAERYGVPSMQPGIASDVSGMKDLIGDARRARDLLGRIRRHFARQPESYGVGLYEASEVLDLYDADVMSLFLGLVHLSAREELTMSRSTDERGPLWSRNAVSQARGK
ncbi:hypothetical protein [Streptomyces sp. NPDC059761]|uniref:hypothetical protein n=1 Tax=Streptomyces sp. NPDC059761 TaxID=3346937 RepID=UPI00365C91D0